MTERKKTAAEILAKFRRDFREKPEGMPVAEWLDREFAAYPELWRDEAERRALARETVGGVEGFRSAKRELAETEAAGGTRADFLRQAIARGAAAGGTADVGRYAADIDRALGKANEMMARQAYTKGSLAAGNPQVNAAPTLEGNLAEAHHAGTFEIDAAAKETGLHAEMPASHELNSADILVTDAKGRVVGRYQSKYGADAKSTEAQFGDRYPDQQKLAPADQAGDVPGATDRVRAGGAESKPLTKEEAVRMKEEAQQQGKVKEYDWNDAPGRVVCKHIAAKAAVAGGLAIGFQGARILGRRVWNAAAGRENKPLEEDLAEFAESAAKSGAAAAGTAAAAGGLLVAARKGVLGAALKTARANVIANAACAAVENVKILARLGSGEIDGRTALDEAGRTNCALVGSLALAGKGATAGAAIGAAFGPVGMAIGGVIGGVVGGIAGSAVGQAIYEGAKAVCKGIGRFFRGLFRVLNPVNWFA